MARSVRRLAVLLCFSSLVGCGGGPDAEVVLAQWFAAVQAADVVLLSAVDASAPASLEDVEEGDSPPGFERWAGEVRTALRRFESQRDAGRVAGDARGYALVRAAGLGRGAFWQIDRRSVREGRTELLIRVNFGYGEIPYGSLPPGTVVYLLGHPLGTIHPIELGRGRRVQLDVLEHAYFEATLSHARTSGAATKSLVVERFGWADTPAVHGVIDWIF